MTDPISVGLLLFPRLTQLDLTGPFEVFSRTPGVTVHLIWKSLDPVTSDSGMSIAPTATFADVPPLDIICVPGGPGVAPLMEDDETLAFLRGCAEQAKYVTSVCTGSLVLGAAGLLKGKRATSHWMSRDLLQHFGAEAVNARIVHDGDTITGGGVTAGIDFALSIVDALRGRTVAEETQLAIEYDPEPPFQSGSPRSADPAMGEVDKQRGAARQQERLEIVQRAAAKLATA